MQGQHFVLVHGAQHGAWCWYKMKNLLEKAGHRVAAVDLMSAGISTVNADHVESFDQYNQPLYDLLESLSLTEKIILVGHSMGGTTVARATERYPNNISVAVYVGAIMLSSGMKINDTHGEIFKDYVGDLQFIFGKGAGNYPTSTWVPLETARRAYYSSCSSEDIQLALMLLRPTPCLTDDSTIFTETGYHSIPRVYIRTLQDKAIAPRVQDQFVAENPPAEVYSLDSDHSPFLSVPSELHQCLLKIAATYGSRRGTLNLRDGS